MHVALGRQEDRFADFRHGRQPLADDLLGILVPLGRVEVADALGVGSPEQAVEPGGLADSPVVEQGHLDARFAQLPRRQIGLLLPLLAPAASALSATSPVVAAVATMPAWRNSRRSMGWNADSFISRCSSLDSGNEN